jgi:hypothetical protein
LVRRRDAVAPSIAFFVHVNGESRAGEHETKIVNGVEAKHRESADPVDVDLKSSKRESAARSKNAANLEKRRLLVCRVLKRVNAHHRISRRGLD